MSSEPFYVGYADYGDRPVHIQLIPKETFGLMREMQPNDERLHRTTIITDSTSEADPVANIIAITTYVIQSDDIPRQIGREVMDWLVENGHFKAGS